MLSKDRVKLTLDQIEVDRFPRQCWALPAVEMFRKDELEDLKCKFPTDFSGAPHIYGKSRYATGNPHMVGEYVDNWGCTWKVISAGITGEVKDPRLKTIEDINAYEVPVELLDGLDLSGVDGFCENADKFVCVGTHVRPFERMQFLRGTENVLVDIALDADEFHILKEKLNSFYIRELNMWANTTVDAVSFMDDWGSQNALMISPDLWRKHFKPLYKKYCDILHNQGKYVFFHSDGNIEEIFSDLIEIGIDAINSQLFCMNIEELGKKYSGKITMWGEIDRQHILAFGTTDDVRGAVDRVAKAFIKDKRTGMIAQCEWGAKDPKENIEAVFDQWNQW